MKVGCLIAAVVAVIGLIVIVALLLAHGGGSGSCQLCGHSGSTGPMLTVRLAAAAGSRS
jgi:hypothetical protein